MANAKFIWCRNSDAVHYVTCYDKAPLYGYIGGELKEMPADDWRAFMKRREGHRLNR